MCSHTVVKWGEAANTLGMIHYGREMTATQPRVVEMDRLHICSPCLKKKNSVTFTCLWVRHTEEIDDG